MVYPLIGVGTAKVAPNVKLFINNKIVTRPLLPVKKWNPGIFRLSRVAPRTKLYRGPVVLTGGGGSAVPTTGQIWPRANR